MHHTQREWEYLWGFRSSVVGSENGYVHVEKPKYCVLLIILHILKAASDQSSALLFFLQSNGAAAVKMPFVASAYSGYPKTAMVYDAQRLMIVRHDHRHYLLQSLIF